MAIFNAHEHDRLQVFMDGTNLHGALRTIQRKIDYKAFIETLRAETRFVRAQYFTTVRPHQDTEQFWGVLNLLSFSGYSVMTKYIRDNMDEAGHIRSKGTMVGDMTVAMLDAADSGTDHIVLMSGDGELTAAVEACKRRDCRVTVVSSEATRVISEDLRRACDQYVDLQDLPEHLWVPSDPFRVVSSR